MKVFLVVWSDCWIDVVFMDGTSRTFYGYEGLRNEAIRLGWTFACKRRSVLNWLKRKTKQRKRFELRMYRENRLKQMEEEAQMRKEGWEHMNNVKPFRLKDYRGSW